MMAIYNRMCVGVVGLVLLSLVIVGAFGIGSAQQPLPLSDPPERATADTLPEIPPSVVPTPVVPSQDYKNDPLFLEIQRIVLEGNKSTQRNAIPGLPLQGVRDSAPLSTEFKIDLISNDRWHAVESILAAARMLEKDVSECRRQSDLEGTSKLHATIKNLRAHALELLQGL